MTMILTCVTKDYVVQASDRRLTRMRGSKPEVIEDHSNKALIYASCFAFAYTGLAELPDQRNAVVSSAIDWAALQLSEKGNLGDAVLHLGNRASDLINLGLIREHARLAFVGAGFADIEEGVKSNRKPLRIVISNFKGESDTWLAQPRRVFSVSYNLLLEDCDFELFVAGQPLSEERHTWLARVLTRFWCLGIKAPGYYRRAAVS